MKRNNSQLSWITIGAGIYIIISASFSRPVWDLLVSHLGEKTLYLVGTILFLAVAAYLLSRIIRFHFSWPRLLFNLALIILVFAFSWQQEYFVKKIHVLEYGFLGWFSVRDLDKTKPASMAIAWSLLFILLIGSWDEIFQAYLPNRYAKISDVIINIIGGGFGIGLFLIR